MYYYIHWDQRCTKKLSGSWILLIFSFFYSDQWTYQRIPLDHYEHRIIPGRQCYFVQASEKNNSWMLKVNYFQPQWSV